MLYPYPGKQAALSGLVLPPTPCHFFVDIVNFMDRYLKSSMKCTCHDMNGQCICYLP